MFCYLSNDQFKIKITITKIKILFRTAPLSCPMSSCPPFYESCAGRPLELRRSSVLPLVSYTTSTCVIVYFMSYLRGGGSSLFLFRIIIFEILVGRNTLSIGKTFAEILRPLRQIVLAIPSVKEKILRLHELSAKQFKDFQKGVYLQRCKLISETIHKYDLPRVNYEMSIKSADSSEVKVPKKGNQRR